jgi:hypothetical protein
MTRPILRQTKTQPAIGGRRWPVWTSFAILMVTTVAVTTGTAAPSTAGAAVSAVSGTTMVAPTRVTDSPASKPVKAKAGTTWVLTDGAFCQTDAFATHRTFAATAANGDAGTFQRRAAKLTMTWTQGPSAGNGFLGRYRKSDKAYTGHYTIGGQGLAATLHLASGPGQSCPLVTAAPRTSSVGVNAEIADTATITGTAGQAPTGSVVFYECPAANAPCDENATGTRSLGSVTVTGSGDVVSATSAPFYTPDPGPYCFSAFYSGDAVDAAVRDDAPPGQCFTITASDGPTLSTTAATDSMALGESNVDTATVTGAVLGVPPTGTVTFYECGPLTGFSYCSTLDSTPDPNTTPLGSPVTLVADSSNSSVATSAAFTPSAVGFYCFYAVYSGDSNNPAGPEVSDRNECFTVARFRPGIAAAPDQLSPVLGDSETDSATISGVDGVDPTGFVDFTVCPGDTDPCISQSPGAQDVGNLPVTDSGPGAVATVTSNDFAPPKAGVYCFSATYSIDPNYANVTDGSLDHQCFTVSPATPVVTSAPVETSVPLGFADSDTVTVTGLTTFPRPTPTGNVDFLVCPAASRPCTAGAPGVLDLGPVPVTDQGVVATATDTSATFTASAVGDYCFAAFYAGDASYAAASDSSPDGCFTVTPEPPVSPVGLGSPENSIGTGGLSLDPAGDTSNIWAAVNGYCTSKENGDEFLSAFDATWNGSTYTCSATPTAQTPGATANDEYNGDDPTAPGYSYDIVTPSATTVGVTTAPITVDAYDPSFEPTQCAGQPGITSSSPFNPVGGQTVDNSLGMATSAITTDYALTYSPDPVNPSFDQPVPSSADTNAQETNPYVASSGDPATCGRWVNLFTIPAGSPNGDYRLQVTTPESEGQLSDGSNAYALRVSDGPAGSWSRCSTIAVDAYYSPDCPSIAGQNALSVYATSSGASSGCPGGAAPAATCGSFYLAQIAPAYAGHELDVNLFDPGEGSKDIELLDPDGTPVSFSWKTSDDCPLPPPNQASTDCAQDLGFSDNAEDSGSGTQLPVDGTVTPPRGIVSNSEFNDRHVQLSFTIPDNYTADNGGWWKIEYVSNGANITDRTTWTVALSGSTPSSEPATAAQRSSHPKVRLRHRPRPKAPAL